MPARFTSMIAFALWLALQFVVPSSLPAQNWSEEQIPKLPRGETPIHLFNGVDFTGWTGHVEKYFFIEEGVIVGRNTEDNAPKSSTYLITNEKYHDFRLIFESRLVTSEMHSGIALWGKPVEKEEGPFSYQGHLVMYPSAYGYYDLFGRNSIYQDTLGVAQKAGLQHEWNQMEIVATGNRICHVVNGRLVADWSDPHPELCGVGPIGLQLHSNSVAQDVQWRGLILTENPRPVLVTATNRDLGLRFDADPVEAGLEPAELSKIDDRMQEFVAQKQIAGAVTLVARRGRVVHHEAVGFADVAAGRPMEKETLFAIASMTKPITAAAVMILRDEGKLELDDPVSKYIPEFKDATLAEGKKPPREITIRDCLRHTNGLVSDQKNTGTLEETSVDLAKSELAFAPGTKWQYGPGLSVAGRVVEIVSEQNFADFLAERIFVPLEMNDTTFHPSEEQMARLAHLYQPTADKTDIEPGHHWLYDVTPDSSPNPSGGLYSTADDLVRFYQMILNGGDLNGVHILSSAAIDEMTALQTEELQTGFTPGNGWGLGFALIRNPQGPTDMLSPGSYGHGGAFGTQGWIDPRREMIYILLIARQNFGNGDASDIRAVFQRMAVNAVRN